MCGSRIVGVGSMGAVHAQVSLLARYTSHARLWVQCATPIPQVLARFTERAALRRRVGNSLPRGGRRRRGLDRDAALRPHAARHCEALAAGLARADREAASGAQGRLFEACCEAYDAANRSREPGLCRDVQLSAPTRGFIKLRALIQGGAARHAAAHELDHH